MAQKRVLKVDSSKGDDAEEEKPSVDPTWSEWGKGTYLRYWYVIGVLALDLFIVLQADALLSFPYSIYASILMLIPLIFGEYRMYMHLWGENGKWTY